MPKSNARRKGELVLGVSELLGFGSIEKGVEMKWFLGLIFVVFCASV